jgi:hypothetical protein
LAASKYFHFRATQHGIQRTKIQQAFIYSWEYTGSGMFLRYLSATMAKGRHILVSRILQFIVSLPLYHPAGIHFLLACSRYQVHTYFADGHANFLAADRRVV